jgi:hypothetical protein
MYRGLRKSVNGPGLLKCDRWAGAIGDLVCDSKPETKATYSIRVPGTTIVPAGSLETHLLVHNAQRIIPSGCILDGKERYRGLI